MLSSLDNESSFIGREFPCIDVNVRHWKIQQYANFFFDNAVIDTKLIN